MEQGDSPRLDFYKTIKKDFGFEDYLLNKYEIRRNIAKIRTSSHSLEIQTERHKNKHRSERICRTCNLEKVETKIKKGRNPILRSEWKSFRCKKK